MTTPDMTRSCCCPQHCGQNPLKIRATPAGREQPAELIAPVATRSHPSGLFGVSKVMTPKLRDWGIFQGATERWRDRRNWSPQNVDVSFSSGGEETSSGCFLEAVSAEGKPRSNACVGK